MNAVSGLCLRIEAVLKRHDPKRLAGLRPGIREADLSRLERALTYPLPEAYRALLRWHDGEADWLANGEPREKGFIWGPSSRFYPLEVALEKRRGLLSTRTALGAGRLPFAQGQDCTWLLDLEPGVPPTPGQVLTLTTDSDREGQGKTHVNVEHTSLENWLEARAQKLERFFL